MKLTVLQLQTQAPPRPTKTRASQVAQCKRILAKLAFTRAMATAERLGVTVGVRVARGTRPLRLSQLEFHHEDMST